MQVRGKDLINNEIMQPNKSEDYKFSKNCRDGFGSYWHQVNEALVEGVNSVLVIGQGDNIVPFILKSQGLAVDTFDIVKDMNPTYVGSVLDIGEIVKRKYDCILCCEVLEHLPLDKLEKIVSQFNDIATQKIIISLPIFGLAGYIKIWAPKYINFTFVIRVPYYKLGHKVMCKEHYWELNSKYVKRKDVDEIFERNFKVLNAYRVKDTPYHMFYILEPKVDKLHLIGEKS